MTKQRDLKRRIRERQERTGESYVAARRAILDEPLPKAPSAIDVVELHDISPVAAELGFRCSVACAQSLLDRIDANRAAAALWNVLLATTADPAFEMFRAIALRGERPTRIRPSVDWQDGVRRFLDRVRAGIGGISDGGSMLALPVAARGEPVMMMCMLGFGLIRESNPAITLSTPESHERIGLRVAISNR